MNNQHPNNTHTMTEKMRQWLHSECMLAAPLMETGESGERERVTNGEMAGIIIGVGGFILLLYALNILLPC